MECLEVDIDGLGRDIVTNDLFPKGKIERKAHGERTEQHDVRAFRCSCAACEFARRDERCSQFIETLTRTSGHLGLTREHRERLDLLIVHDEHATFLQISKIAERFGGLERHDVIGAAFVADHRGHRIAKTHDRGNRATTLCHAMDLRNLAALPCRTRNTREQRGCGDRSLTTNAAKQNGECLIAHIALPSTDARSHRSRSTERTASIHCTYRYRSTKSPFRDRLKLRGIPT